MKYSKHSISRDACAALIGIVASQAGWAQSPIAMTPPVPRIGATPSGVVAVDFNGTHSVQIRWYEDELSLTQATLPATHFAVCARAATIVCTWPTGSTTGVISGAATDPLFARTAVFSPPNPFRPNAPRFLLGYDYTATITLDNASYDRQLKWGVAACASANAASCTFSVGSSIWYSTKELVADVRLVPSGGDVIVTAEAANIGTSNAHTFTSRITAYPALIGASGACAKNPNEAGLGITNSTKIITEGGATILAGTLWNGTSYDVSGIGVAGIVYSTRLYSATATTTVGSPLPPVPDEEHKTDMVGRSVTKTDVPMQKPKDPLVALVAVAKIDDLNQVTEAQETNNARAECKVFGR